MYLFVVESIKATQQGNENIGYVDSHTNLSMIAIVPKTFWVCLENHFEQFCQVSTYFINLFGPAQNTGKIPEENLNFCHFQRNLETHNLRFQRVIYRGIFYRKIRTAC